MTPLDDQQRETALDVEQSFIVQAPAGSGKTSLLTHRVLRLLAQVNKPEEILAITFTKKAAAEMQHRIMQALKLARKPCPDIDYLKKTWILSTRVLEQDANMHWNLLDNPNRLRVQTIDALCASLTKQMPVLARFGATPTVTQDAQPLYLEAAKNCLEEVDSETDGTGELSILLSHVDNQFSRAQNLIANMLASRDQWLRHVMEHHANGSQREQFEDVLKRAINTALLKVNTAFSHGEKESLIHLISFAGDNLPVTDQSLDQWLKEGGLERNDEGSLDGWLLLVDFLLTAASKPAWRKSANAVMGFPAPSGTKDKEQAALYKGMKADYVECIKKLAEKELLLEKLTALRYLPAPSYSDKQWSFIEALLNLLPQALAHLRLVFKQHGQVDFCEVSLSASHALHDETGVSDLALKLDYQLQHILVDEFQDTSETQFELLKDLLVGWQKGDGRSLFLVGDPMQSIYRFRQAEVGLFLQTQRHGLGEVNDITPLSISTNFRSQANIVNWVNKAFKDIMPIEDDMFSGAVSYKPSVAVKGLENSSDENQAVQYLAHTDREREGDAVCELIQTIQQQHPNESIGVLVRGRKSLEYLVPALNKADVTFQATDIDPLNKRQIVIDLLSLTRAYLQPADRIAWLSVLRSPWCGLTLDDLYHLTEQANDQTILDRLQQQYIERLSEDGQQRLLLLMKSFVDVLQNRQRMSLASAIKGLWVSIAGPDCLRTKADLEDAMRYFDCLVELENSTQVIDIKLITDRVDKLFAANQVSIACQLEIMTIHKSKGLEFDHVILPGLDRLPGKGSPALLQWLERPTEHASDNELLIAPIKETGIEKADPISQYLNKIETEKAIHESQRLLYVAATRAKNQLYLSFSVKHDEKKDIPKKPAESSLLGLLWPVLKDAFSYKKENDVAYKESLLTDCKINRRELLPDVLGTINSRDISLLNSVSIETENQPPSFNSTTNIASLVGTVIHQLMQVVGQLGIDRFSLLGGENQQAIISKLLFEIAVPSDQLDELSQRVSEVISNCLEDDRGRWVLSNNHSNSAFEHPISGLVEGQIIRCRLDRTFIENGIRWIIDYKSSNYEGTEPTQFLAVEKQRHQAQLNQYATLMSQLESLPIKLGLYYPVAQAWIDWDYRKNS